MADISKVSIPNVQNPYDIKDAKARGALVPVINKGSKNVAVPYIPASISGITITANADGSFKFECSSVSENKIFRVGDIGNQPSGTFTISGVTGGSSSTYMLGLYNTSASAVVYQHSSSSSSYTGDVSGFSLRVRIIAGYTGTFTVYPMICTSAEYAISPEYEPYAPTNRELYEDKATTEDVYGTTTTIAPASGETYNLNDLPIGRFQVPSSTYAQRITNSPTTGSGYDIECKYNGSSSYKYQIARPNRAGSAAFDIYVRHFGTTWSDWETVLTNTKVDSTPTESSQNPVSSGGVWAPLSELVDEGAKNLCNVADFPTTTAPWNQSILGDGVTLPAGEYILSFTNITSNADGTLMQLLFAKDISFAELTSDYYHITKGTNTSIKIRLTGDTTAIRIYAGSSYAGSQGKSLSFSGFMICTAADWAISQKFVPYCPSLPEVYEGNLKTTSHNFASSLNSNIISINDSAFVIYKYGNVCMARVSLKVSGTLTGSDTISSTAVPANYRPIANVYQSVTGRDQGSWALSTLEEVGISVGTDGAVILRTGTKASSTVYVIGTITWICA